MYTYATIGFILACSAVPNRSSAIILKVKRPYGSFVYCLSVVGCRKSLNRFFKILSFRVVSAPASTRLPNICRNQQMELKTSSIISTHHLPPLPHLERLNPLHHGIRRQWAYEAFLH